MEPLNKKTMTTKKLAVKSILVESKSEPGSFYRVTRHSDKTISCKRADNGYPCKGWMYGMQKGIGACRHIKEVKSRLR